MVHCFLKFYAAFFYPVFSTESPEIVTGYFQEGKERVELLQHVIEINYVFLNFFGLNSYSTVDCNVNVLKSATKVFLLSLCFLFFSTPKIHTCTASVAECLTCSSQNVE